MKCMCRPGENCQAECEDVEHREVRTYNLFAHLFPAVSTQGAAGVMQHELAPQDVEDQIHQDIKGG